MSQKLNNNFLYQLFLSFIFKTIMRLWKIMMRNPRLIVISAMIMALLGATPVVAAVLVQRSIDAELTVEDSPITLSAGADAASTTYLDVTIGTTDNDDVGDGIGTNTLLANATIDFTCFAGDRTIYSDVIQVENNTVDSWDIGYTLDTASISDTFGTAPADASADADIYIYVSDNDSTTAITTNPISTPADWLADFLQLEVVAATLQVTGNTATDAITADTVAAGEQRQIAIVVDCGTNMSDEVAPGNSGTFTINVEASPT